MVLTKLKTLRRRRRLRRAALVCAALACAGFALLLAWPMDTGRYLRAEASPELLDRSGRLLYPLLSDDRQWCFERDLTDISPRLVQATLAAEDQRFRSHPGVDPVALARAFGQNLRARRVVSGASTLTMQVVKLGGTPSASLTGKFRQLAGAVRLEGRASKDAILTAYLNKAPYGLNLVGCEAAARRYFGKPASELTLPEAALLAGLPKSPTGFMPLEHADRALMRRNYVLDRMLEQRFVTAEECDAAKQAPLGAKNSAFPQLAPHLAQRLAPLMRERGRLVTTIDEKVQAMAERAVRLHLASLGKDVTNASLVVADPAAGEIRAWVGSVDFFGAEDGAKFDAARGLRSPGSTLKPFAYALAMDNQCLYASEMLLDDTLDYGSFSPRNSDRLHRGLVSARDALRQSLNVPAVQVVERLGTATVRDFLQGIGLTTLGRSAEDYGLGLALGNCEARLDELMAAYCALANLGECRPLRVLADAPQADAKQVLSRGACLEIYDILRATLPGEFDAEQAGAIGIRPPLCWKTGTSTGNHDAWSFVFNAQYVVGAWVGNNDRRPSPLLVGARAALPLAGRVFRRLPASTSSAWPAGADDLRPVDVCALSGLPASEWCPQTKSVMMSRGSYVNRVCDVHWPRAAAKAIVASGTAELGVQVARPSGPRAVGDPIGEWQTLTSPSSETVEAVGTSDMKAMAATGQAASTTDGQSPGVLERWPGSAHGWDLADVRNAITVDTAQAGGGAPTGSRSQAGDHATSRSLAAAVPVRLRNLRILTPVSAAQYVLTGEQQGDRLRPRTSLDAASPIHWYLDDRFVGTAQPDAPVMVPLRIGTHRLACMTPDGAEDHVEFVVLASPGGAAFQE